MKIKSLTLIISAFLPINAMALEVVVLNDTTTRIGHEGYPILLKSSEGCSYFGKAKSSEIGFSDVAIERKVCNVEGTLIETSVELNGQVKSQVHLNSATGEKVNHIAAGTKFNITD